VKRIASNSHSHGTQKEIAFAGIANWNARQFVATSQTGPSGAGQPLQVLLIREIVFG
jgi:hypothetical protein